MTFARQPANSPATTQTASSSRATPSPKLTYGHTVTSDKGEHCVVDPTRIYGYGVA